jgi:hypothetical protein
LPTVVLALLIAAGSPQAAEDRAPSLELPITCEPGDSCWIVNYVDADTGPGSRDYACGTLTYDGHDGTDIAIRDRAVMAQGVPVLAAAPGVVRAVRDGMPDMTLAEIGQNQVAGRECGNGAIIDHEGGWATQYCHLRSGSLSVRPQDRVMTGQKLGLVGLSGRTEFPHLEFVVWHRDRKLDPFVGLEPTGDCALGSSPLWSARTLAALEYRPLAIYNSGFSDSAPKAKDVRQGQHHNTRLSADAPALVFWVEIFGVKAGDQLILRILAPDGEQLVQNRSVLEKRQARRFQYVGKRRRASSWPSGRYRGQAVIIRGDAGTRLELHRDDAVELR